MADPRQVSELNGNQAKSNSVDPQELIRLATTAVTLAERAGKFPSRVEPIEPLAAESTN